jgi:AcrR family transcriptional regulator
LEIRPRLAWLSPRQSAKGPSGFTFAEAARSAGVSPAAPYRHFRDREELLANVARRGFEQFEAALKAAWKDGVPNPFSAFEPVGRAYLEFARTEPAHYSAMFEGGVPLEVSQEFRDAGERAFAVIRSAAERLVAQSLRRNGRRLSWWRCMYGRSPTASLRCSAAVIPEGGGCQCHRRSSWRRACWSISGGSDFPIARPVRGDPGAMPGNAF